MKVKQRYPSDNGNTARKFFHDKHRQDVLDLYPTATPVEREAIDQLLSYSDVITRVLNSSRKVRIEAFEQYVYEAYLHRITIFHFWPMNDSVHRMWGHCIDKIRELGGYSLGLISETPLERMHKIVRDLLKNHSRPGRIDKSFTDVFHHMWFHSSPSLRKMRKMSKKPVKLDTPDDYKVESFLYDRA